MCLYSKDEDTILLLNLFIVSQERLKGTDLEYRCSENETITKWFSHALASIHTPEAIELINKFSHSDDPGVAKEMTYRLAKIKA